MIDYIDEFLDHMEVSYTGSEHTRRSYFGDIKQFSNYFEDEDLLKLELSDAQDYITHLNKLGSSHSSISRKISALRSFYLFLQQNYGIANNPFSHIKIKQEGRQLPKFLTHLEMETLLLSCSDDPIGVRNQTLIELMYACGFRLSEIVSLRLSDIDLEERSIRIIGKGDKERLLFYYDDFQDKLLAYLKITRKYFLGNKHHDYVFTNHKGDPLSAAGVTYILEKAGKDAGLNQKLHPHILRHTFATHLIDNGASIRVVQTLLGHESLSTTQIYTHVSLKRIKQVYDGAMEKLILT